MPPTALGEASVLVLGVDDRDLDAPIQVAQQFELDQVGLARAGAAEDDGVVVVHPLAEPIPVHQTLGADVVAVEHPGRRRHAGRVGRGQVG